MGFEMTPPTLLLPVIAAWAAATLVGQAQSLMVRENSVTRVSDHVHAIVGFPNIAIVVGNRSTLVVDTGMGPRNGRIIAGEVQKISKNPTLFLTTTHYHPEHSAGEGGFPPGAILIRNRAQDDELQELGEETLARFISRSAANRELLEGVKMRAADIVYDREMKLDLGGVAVRMMWFGPAHTKGDQMLFVEPDGVLISGDIVESKMVPALPNENASVKGWLAILDKVEPLKPRFVVPDHGALGDGSLIQQERAFILDVQGRALELKQQGVSADDAGKRVQSDIQAKYTDWPNLNGVPNVVRRVYAESP